LKKKIIKNVAKSKERTRDSVDCIKADFSALTFNIAKKKPRNNYQTW